MRRVGIYGGSFNPIHNGHLALAEAFIKACELDEVWFVVSPQNPFKADSRLLDDNVRLRLTQMAVEGRSGMRVSDVEFRLPRPSYMWNTLQKLTHDHPHTTFTLLIGGDNWAAFDRWYRSADILSHYAVAVYPRPESPIDAEKLPRGVTLIDAPLLNISSTEVRRAVASGEPVDHLMPKKVAETIRNEHLYQSL